VTDWIKIANRRSRVQSDVLLKIRLIAYRLCPAKEEIYEQKEEAI